MHRKMSVGEHAERYSGCAFRFGPVASKVKNGQMSRADEFDGTIICRAAHDQGRKLPSKRAFRKNTVCSFDHSLKGKIGSSQAAKSGVQMAHEHGSGDTFARDITEKEEQSAIGFEHVAIIAADRSRRLVVIPDLPARGRQLGRRQQPLLNARREFEIGLQGALFLAREMVKAKTNKRIGQQTLFFDGVMT